MQKCLLFLSLLILPISYTSTHNPVEPFVSKNMVTTIQMESHKLYDEMHLNDIINYTAFEKAIAGYKSIAHKNKDILTIIDFTKPSTEERFYVIDMRHKMLLFTSVVSHGKNSGGNYATSFSNEVGSYKSSLGFYVTENTYQGRNGYSLVLDGLEKGINDRAKERAIVIHGAAYSDPSVAASSGRLGRSFGCPALPLSVSKPIINTIKNGTLLFIYANDQKYLSQSSILSGENERPSIFNSSHL